MQNIKFAGAVERKLATTDNSIDSAPTNLWFPKSSLNAIHRISQRIPRLRLLSRRMDVDASPRVCVEARKLTRRVASLVSLSPIEQVRVCVGIGRRVPIPCLE